MRENKQKKWRIKRTPHNLFLIFMCYASIIEIIICGSLLDSEHYIPCLVLIGISVGWLVLFYKVNKNIIDRYIYYNYYEDYDEDIRKECMAECMTEYTAECMAECDKCFYKIMYHLNYDFLTGKENNMIIKNESGLVKDLSLGVTNDTGVFDRAKILAEANHCICGQRELMYGSPEYSFNEIAKLWSAYKDTIFTAEDVAIMMVLMKVARVKNSGSGNIDSFIDICGYAACAGEIYASNKSVSK